MLKSPWIVPFSNEVYVRIEPPKLDAAIGFQALHLELSPRCDVRGPSTVIDPRLSPPKCVRHRCHTMGTAPTTWSTMRTQRTRRPTYAASCTTTNQRYGRCSH